MSPAKFEPAIQASEQSQNYALGRAVIGVLTVMWFFLSDGQLLTLLRNNFRSRD